MIIESGYQLFSIQKYDTLLIEERSAFMEKQVLDFVVEKTHELMLTQTCCQELKDAAQKWLDAIGTDNEVAETKNYFVKLEEDIMPIDQLIGFAGSEAGANYFGIDLAQNIADHAKEIKAAGAKYCDCPACSAVEAILEKKEFLLP